jgi:hypothetical protein
MRTKKIETQPAQGGRNTEQGNAGIKIMWALALLLFCGLTANSQVVPPSGQPPDTIWHTVSFVGDYINTAPQRVAHGGKVIPPETPDIVDKYAEWVTQIKLPPEYNIPVPAYLLWDFDTSRVVSDTTIYLTWQPQMKFVSARWYANNRKSNISANAFYRAIDGFDKECFLTGTLDDYFGHIQAFTENKSSNLDSDTMRYRCVTTYRRDDEAALLVESLFSKDYSDIQIFRTCTETNSHQKYYHKLSEAPCESGMIELFSPSLVKITAGYFIFDSVNKVNNGAPAYIGVIDKDKLQTEVQKLSYIAGVLYRYGIRKESETGKNTYRISNPCSAYAIKACHAFLNDLGCNYVKLVESTVIQFTPAAKLQRIIDVVMQE